MQSLQGVRSAETVLIETPYTRRRPKQLGISLDYLTEQVTNMPCSSVSDCKDILHGKRILQRRPRNGAADYATSN